MFIDNSHLRPLRDAELDEAGSLVYEAYAESYRDRGLLEPIADGETAAAALRDYVATDPGGCLGVFKNDQLAGIGCIHNRGEVASIGPVAVHKRHQGERLGKRLITALIEHAGERRVRAFIDAFNMHALGLAIRTGFEAHATAVQLAALGGLRGPGRLLSLGEHPVREMTADDLDAVDAFDAPAFGGSRRADLASCLDRGTGWIAEEQGAVTAFLLGRVDGALGILGPGAAQDAALLAVLMAKLGDALPGANIVRTTLMASHREVVDAALQMGFRGTSAMIAMRRGDGDAFALPCVIAQPTDIA